MENKQDKLVKSITGRDEDFAQWYTDVCRKAELMDYTQAKGFIIYRPYGYAIWENIQKYLDNRFKKSGHENVYMPLVIPESLFMKEAEHVKGFAPETAIITIGGKEELAERLIIRPTSEVLFCEHYAKIVSSYRDLPKKYNQWCSVVRWEKTTRPFLRGSEFLWQEGHTIHATETEAREEVLGMLDIYNELGRDLLAIPFILGKKTDKEKFAGAEETYTIEALMHDGKALQSGTTHYFGTGFAKAFNINFQDKDGVVKPVYQTSWGLSTRLIGAIIMVHGDDSGLVLPPYAAPIQAIIIPIQASKPGVMENALALYKALDTLGIRVKIDDSDKTPGWKFSEYEMKGVPLRIEIGPRDLETGDCIIVKRIDNSKEKVKISELPMIIEDLLASIHRQMYDKALANVAANIRPAYTYEEFKNIIENQPGYVKMMWCGNVECENKIKEDTTATSRCMPFVQERLGEVCPVCGRKAEKEVLFAKAY
ncbi:MAG: proline--tRNA ligase [Candidatus Izemoplasmatales bacterium]|nr:proline--tRNA ligase [Candidatus Izemoplasmatales bacterium]MDD3865334.1 proline--tRNA ligase [Candidatus Izemoplasmatales bacterium]